MKEEQDNALDDLEPNTNQWCHLPQKGDIGITHYIVSVKGKKLFIESGYPSKEIIELSEIIHPEEPTHLIILFKMICVAALSLEGCPAYITKTVSIKDMFLTQAEAREEIFQRLTGIRVPESVTKDRIVQSPAKKGTIKKAAIKKAVKKVFKTKMV